MKRFELGEFTIYVASHGGGQAPPEWMFPEIPSPELADQIESYVDREGNIEFAYSSLIVTVGSTVLLLDAGSPTAHGQDGPAVLAALDEAEFSAREVDAVLVTHGHPDHVGGLIVGPASDLVFPQAKHYVSRAEFDFWTSSEASGTPASQVFGAIDAIGDLELVPTAIEVEPGLEIVPTPGHTPGHVAIVIGTEGERALYAGDVLAHTVNVSRPDWNHFSDMLPAAARESRAAVVDMAADGRHLLFASHIPSAGKIQSTGAEREFVPVDWFADVTIGVLRRAGEERS